MNKEKENKTKGDEDEAKGRSKKERRDRELRRMSSEESGSQPMHRNREVEEREVFFFVVLLDIHGIVQTNTRPKRSRMEGNQTINPPTSNQVAKK